MLFFDDKLLLKYSGVTGDFLAYNRAKTASVAAEAAFVKISDEDIIHANKVLDVAIAADDALEAAKERAKMFKFFESKTDAALSALSIISAPICLTLLALDEMLSFLKSTLIFTVYQGSEPEASKAGAEALNHLLEACKSLLLAIVSPVVNTVDVIGRCVASVTQNDGGQGDSYTDEYDRHYFNKDDYSMDLDL